MLLCIPEATHTPVHSLSMIGGIPGQDITHKTIYTTTYTYHNQGFGKGKAPSSVRPGQRTPRNERKP